ncbi:ATP-binding protein [Ideonella sp. YS5]|uniref:ATP-binding response regulator n=1 Tax=Ideonella sp. YS5 TaxID=3453714 RepID=UPI003EE95754
MRRWWGIVGLAGTIAVSAIAASAPAKAGDAWRSAFLVAEQDAQASATKAEADRAEAVRAGQAAAELQALVALTLDYDYLDELDRHPELVQRGAELAAQLHDAEAASWFGELRARALADDGQQEQALAAFARLVGEAERDHLARLPWVYVAQGDALSHLGQRYQALRSHSRAYEIFEAAGERLGMAAALTGIAGSHADGSDAASQVLAHEYVGRALALVDPERHRRMATILNLRLGVTLQRRERLDEARSQLERALQMAQGLGLSRWAAEARYFLAKLELQQHRPAEALQQLDRALPVFRGQRDKTFNVASAAVRAQALAGLSRKSDALASLDEGSDLLRRVHNPRLEAFFRLAAAQVYGSQAEDRQALQQLLALREIERQLSDEASAQMAQELKVKFGVELQQRENALLRAEQQQAQIRRYGLLGALVLSIAALGTLVLLLRKRAALAGAEASHQAALARAQAQANQAKSAFLARMSHELRTPLNAVLGYAQLMQWDRTASPKTLEGLRIIEQSGRHLLSLIDDTLNLARIEAGRLELSPAPLALEPFLQGVADLVRVRAEHKGIGFELVLRDLPPAVQADEKQLRQVLLNLLANAVKFTDHGRVLFEVRAIAAAGDVTPGQARLRFAVSDTGVGISPAELPALFRPFQQVGDSERRAAGTGLGLAISQQIVRLMGGEITVTSTPGQGSEFSFELALAPAEAPAGAPANVRHVSGYDGPRRQLLVIDDVAANRKLLADALRPLGFIVHEAADGDEGLARARDLKPDLILIDNAMPVMDGIEATRRLRQLPGLAQVPVLAVSASASAQDRAEALAAGANDFLSKPVQMERLLALIEKHLGLVFSPA